MAALELTLKPGRGRARATVHRQTYAAYEFIPARTQFPVAARRAILSPPCSALITHWRLTTDTRLRELAVPGSWVLMAYYGLGSSHDSMERARREALGRTRSR